MIKKMMYGSMGVATVCALVGNYFFTNPGMTSSAVAQLEDSDIIYGVASRLATANHELGLFLFIAGGWICTILLAGTIKKG